MNTRNPSWVLSVTSACVNLHFKLTITSNASYREHLKAFANYCKHYQINEHSRTSWGVLSVTFDHYHDYCGLRQS